METVLWLLFAPFVVALVLLCVVTVAVFVLSVVGLVVDASLKALHAVPDGYESAPTRWGSYFDFK